MNVTKEMFDKLESRVGRLEDTKEDDHRYITEMRVDMIKGDSDLRVILAEQNETLNKRITCTLDSFIKFIKYGVYILGGAFGIFQLAPILLELAKVLR